MIDLKQTGDKIVDEQGIPGKQPLKNEDVLSILLSNVERFNYNLRVDPEKEERTLSPDPYPRELQAR